MSEWKKIRIGDVLTESKIESEIPNTERRITVRLNAKGVEKRPDTNDKAGATKYYIRKAGQFIYGKQNLHKGAFGIIPNELNGFETSSDIPAFDISDKCHPDWLIYWFTQGDFYKSLEKFARGVGSKRINISDFFDIEIMLPSLEKQLEILKHTKQIHIINYHLSTQLTHQKSLLKKLRQSILQDAVSGKLTEQWRKDNPVTESAVDLLKRIQTEKAELLKSGKIKKQKPLPPVKAEEIPFGLPESWVWCRLGEVTELITSGSRDWARHYKDDGKAKFVRMGNLSHDWFILKNNNIARVNPPNNSEGNRTSLIENDLLISITGDVGWKGLVPENFGEAYINQHTALVRFLPFLRSTFFPISLCSPFSNKQFLIPQRGIKNSFRLTDISEHYIPLPPLAEQQAIVIKVEALLKHCDQLEAEITASEQNAQMLLQTVLKEAFNPV